MDRTKLPHLRAGNKQQQQSNSTNGNVTKNAHAEPRSNLPSNANRVQGTVTSGSAWSGNRSASLLSNLRGPAVVKPTTPTAWKDYASKASSSKAYAGQASSSKASNMEQLVTAHSSPQCSSFPHTRGDSTATTQAPKPTPTMNAGKIAKSAKHDSKVPCTYENCTRGFTKETDMKRHKDEDHEWCRLCNVDCADDEALLEHKVQSEMHICCDICGEDFRSDNGKERHMRQVRS